MAHLYGTTAQRRQQDTLLDHRISRHRGLLTKIDGDLQGRLEKKELADRLDRADEWLTKADRVSDPAMARGFRDLADEVLTAPPIAEIQAEITKVDAQIDLTAGPALDRTLHRGNWARKAELAQLLERLPVTA
jgi:hypothetical protein